MACGNVWVLDASALIEVKKMVSGNHQWNFFKALEAMVEDGHIAFPRQVVKELKEGPHPDVPGAWIQGVARATVHPLDADVEVVAEVMAGTNNLVDPNAEGDPADPWVIALAMDIAKDQDLEVMVVTNDHTNHHGNDSLASACDKLGVTHIRVDEFIEEVDF